MIVVITNKQKAIIDRSQIATVEHKCATGLFASESCIQTIQSLQVETLVLDVTALSDAYEMLAWKAFKNFIDPKQVIILLESTKSSLDVNFLAMLVTMGFYNFATTEEDINRLMETPNTRDMVEQYPRLALEQTKKKNNPRGVKELVEEGMKEDGEEHPEDGEQRKQAKKKNILFTQIKIGLFVLPILTFLSVYIIYLLEIWLDGMIPIDGSAGKILYQDYYQIGINTFQMLTVIVPLLVFTIYYTYLNMKISQAQMTRGKFIVIPFAIFVALLFGEYHLVGKCQDLFQATMFMDISSKPYLVTDLYSYFELTGIFAIFLFYFKILFFNSRTARFEKDLSQKFTFFEKLWILDLMILTCTPLIYYVVKKKAANLFLYDWLHSIYDGPFVMMVLTIIEIVLTLMIIVNTKFKKEKQYTILREEDL